MSTQDRLKVTLWVPRFWPAMGGTELHTHALAHHLADIHTVDVITHADTNDCASSTLARDAVLSQTTRYHDGNITIHRTGFDGIKKTIGAFIGRFHNSQPLFRKLFSLYFRCCIKPRTAAITQNSDLIHYVYNGLTDAALLAAEHAELQGIPFVFTPNVLNTAAHGSPWDSGAFHHLYGVATSIIALTQHEADWLVARGVCASKLTVVPYGPILEPSAEAARFRRRIHAEDDPIVLFLGRVVPIKGYDLLLTAIQQVWQDHPTARLVFVGPAIAASRTLISALDDTRVTLIEDIDQQGKADALAACDMLCVPSSMESLGVVYIEAAFNAKPVIACRLPVLEQVIEHEKDGFLVSPDALSIADAIACLLADDQLRKTMGRHAAEKAHERYDWSTVSHAVTQVYRQALARHATRAHHGNTASVTQPIPN